MGALTFRGGSPHHTFTNYKPLYRHYKTLTNTKV